MYDRLKTIYSSLWRSEQISVRTEGWIIMVVEKEDQTENTNPMRSPQLTEKLT